MDTKITNFTEEELKKITHTDEKGDTIMYDDEGREWTLLKEFETKEGVKKAENLVSSFLVNDVDKAKKVLSITSC